MVVYKYKVSTVKRSGELASMMEALKFDNKIGILLLTSNDNLRNFPKELLLAFDSSSITYIAHIKQDPEMQLFNQQLQIYPSRLSISM